MVKDTYTWTATFGRYVWLPVFPVAVLLLCVAFWRRRNKFPISRRRPEFVLAFMLALAGLDLCTTIVTVWPDEFGCLLWMILANSCGNCMLALVFARAWSLYFMSRLHHERMAYANRVAPPDSGLIRAPTAAGGKAQSVAAGAEGRAARAAVAPTPPQSGPTSVGGGEERRERTAVPVHMRARSSDDVKASDMPNPSPSAGDDAAAGAGAPASGEALPQGTPPITAAHKLHLEDLASNPGSRRASDADPIDAAEAAAMAAAASKYVAADGSAAAAGSEKALIAAADSDGAAPSVPMLALTIMTRQRSEGAESKKSTANGAATGDGGARDAVVTIGGAPRDSGTADATAVGAPISPTNRPRGLLQHRDSLLAKSSGSAAVASYYMRHRFLNANWFLASAVTAMWLVLSVGWIVTVAANKQYHSLSFSFAEQTCDPFIGSVYQAAVALAFVVAFAWSLSGVTNDSLLFKFELKCNGALFVAHLVGFLCVMSWGDADWRVAIWHFTAVTGLLVNGVMPILDTRRFEAFAKASRAKYRAARAHRAAKAHGVTSKASKVASVTPRSNAFGLKTGAAVGGATERTGGGGGGGGSPRTTNKSSLIAALLLGNTELLATLLAHPAGFALFRKFLDKEFSTENLLMWHDAKAFRVTYAKIDTFEDAQQMVADAIDLFDKYLAPTAPLEVNVSSWIKAELGVVISLARADPIRYAQKSFQKCSQQQPGSGNLHAHGPALTLRQNSSAGPGTALAPAAAHGPAGTPTSARLAAPPSVAINVTGTPSGNGAASAVVLGVSQATIGSMTARASTLTIATTASGASTSSGGSSGPSSIGGVTARASTAATSGMLSGRGRAATIDTSTPAAAGTFGFGFGFPNSGGSTDRPVGGHALPGGGALTTRSATFSLLRKSAASAGGEPGTPKAGSSAPAAHGTPKHSTASIAPHVGTPKASTQLSTAILIGAPTPRPFASARSSAVSNSLDGLDTLGLASAGVPGVTPRTAPPSPKPVTQMADAKSSPAIRATPAGTPATAATNGSTVTASSSTIPVPALPAARMSPLVLPTGPTTGRLRIHTSDASPALAPSGGSAAGAASAAAMSSSTAAATGSSAAGSVAGSVAGATAGTPTSRIGAGNSAFDAAMTEYRRTTTSTAAADAVRIVVTCELFARAEREVYELMANDSLVRFLNSPLFAQFEAEHGSLQAMLPRQPTSTTGTGGAVAAAAAAAAPGTVTGTGGSSPGFGTTTGGSSPAPPPHPHSPMPSDRLDRPTILRGSSVG